MILKDLRAVLGKDQFRQLLYSSLTGVQILVRGPNIERLESLYGLSSLIPRACRRVKTQATEYMDPNKCNFIGMYIIITKILKYRYFIKYFINNHINFRC